MAVPLLGESNSHVMELESIISALAHLPLTTEKNLDKLKEAKREKEVIKRRLAVLFQEKKEIKEALDLSLRELNGVKSQPQSFDALDELMSSQAYRPSFWQVATEEINYRRFFDVNELAATRVEEPEVFYAVHELIFWLIQQGWITGIRVDHVDGLYDPQQYLSDLQEGCRQALSVIPAKKIDEPPNGAEAYSPGEGSPGRGDAPLGKKELAGTIPAKKIDEPPNGAKDSLQGTRPFYIIVEKILGQTEEIRPEWAIYGTTGYDFLNLLNGIYVDRSQKQAFQELYGSFTGESQRTSDLVYHCKKVILFSSMSSEIHALSILLDAISEQHRWSQDFTLGSLRFALREIIACFSVYRSYVRGGKEAIDGESRKQILAAVREAKRRCRFMGDSIFDFIQSVLLLEDTEGKTAAQMKERRAFVMRLQQLTGVIMAKGVEDTAFFCSYPLASLNEVGADLGAFGVSLDRFHTENQKRLEKWPDALLATSTHDTKRSEDVRARLNVLSEIPEEWKNAIKRWHGINLSKKKINEDEEIPSRNEEYLLYQELVGSWLTLDDNYVERIQRQMKKVLREAKIHTNWLNPNLDYEGWVDEFIKKILNNNEENAFLADFLKFIEPISKAGMWNSLSQTLLKMTSPGIPDFFQGSELWYFHLVDPDNRDAVDYSIRQKLLKEIQERSLNDRLSLIHELKNNLEDGRIKLFLINEVLNFRKNNQRLFARGAYIPLRAEGHRKEHIISFSRRLREGNVIIAAPRFLSGFLTGGQDWNDSVIELPPEFYPGRYRDLLTNEEIAVVMKRDKAVLQISEVFRYLPFSLLVRCEK
jgi:(1->4)-alpha-D-glucan 1-alpha-D-glucosylmutase